MGFEWRCEMGLNEGVKVSDEGDGVLVTENWVLVTEDRVRK